MQLVWEGDAHAGLEETASPMVVRRFFCALSGMNLTAGYMKSGLRRWRGQGALVFPAKAYPKPPIEERQKSAVTVQGRMSKRPTFDNEIASGTGKINEPNFNLPGFLKPDSLQHHSIP